MEFETIVFLLIALFYFFSLLGKNRQKQQRQGQTSTPAEPRPRDAEVDDALREIREALGWPGPEPEARVPRPEDARTEPRQSQSERQHWEGPRPAPTQQPVERGELPSTTRAPEHARSEGGRTEGAAVRPEPSAFDRFTGPIRGPQERKKEPSAKLPPAEFPSHAERSAEHPLLKRLRSKEGAREAVVFAEIFGSPRWKTRRRGGTRS